VAFLDDADVRVVDDVVSAAYDLFLERAPRRVLLTGGSTPKLLFERLAGAELPWEEMEFFLSDERCVPRSDQRSNVRMAHEALLDHVPARAYDIDGGSCDADGYERVLRERFGDSPRFDLALYGMGPDGHTASLFPGHPEVRERERWVVRVPEAGWTPYVPRVSLTVPVLSAAKLGLYLIEGEDKRGAWWRLSHGDDIPAAAMTPEQLIVLVDPAAAGRD
jgi:6-phosphogluconolactonase